MINIWAKKWGILPAAIADLAAHLGALTPDPAIPRVGSNIAEATVQARIRIEASMKGVRLWRNNLGAAIDNRGNYIRYGLANDSPAMNAAIKSSDLIGIRPVHLPDGRIIGQFVAREVKCGAWCYTGTPQEKAQLNFLELVASLGGDAQFANGNGTI
jgi:hypothetical protein